MKKDLTARNYIFFNFCLFCHQIPEVLEALALVKTLVKTLVYDIPKKVKLFIKYRQNLCKEIHFSSLFLRFLMDMSMRHFSSALNLQNKVSNPHLFIIFWGNQ